MYWDNAWARFAPCPCVGGGLVKLYKEDKDREEKKKERSLCCSGPRCIQGSSPKKKKKRVGLLLSGGHWVLQGNLFLASP